MNCLWRVFCCCFGVRWWGFLGFLFICLFGFSSSLFKYFHLNSKAVWWGKEGKLMTNKSHGLSGNTIVFPRCAFWLGVCIYWIIKCFIFLQMLSFASIGWPTKYKALLVLEKLELQRDFCQSSYLKSLQEYKKWKYIQFRKYLIYPNPHSEIISLSFICMNDPPVACGHPCGALGQYYCQRKIFSN